MSVRLSVIDRPPDIGSSIGAIDPELIERFRSDLKPRWLEQGTLGVAVSGGPDSLALLLLAAAAFPDQVEAATVDHGLRSESADEAQLVASICAALVVPHAILTVAVPAGNVQANARAVRYRALTEWATDRAINPVMTAHHAEDQAETMLMRLNRASGLSGLCGIRANTSMPNKDIDLVRPLLAWSKAELQAVVQSSGVSAIDDPSNHSDVYDRVRIRKALDGADWLDAKSLAASAQHLAEVEDTIQIIVGHESVKCVRQSRDQVIYRPHGPPLIRKRIVEMTIAKFAGGEPRGGQVSDLVQKLERGENANLAGVMVTVKNGVWTFRPEPTRNTG